MSSVVRTRPDLKPIGAAIRYRLAAQRRQGQTLLPAPSMKQAAHIPDVGDCQSLHRLQPEVGQTGVHPALVKSVAGLYGSMVMVFWLVFGSGEAALALGFITVLGVMFFGLLTGLTLLADTHGPARRTRSLSEFLNGRVITFTGWITGREAALQMLTLPALLVVTAVVLGVICRLNAH
jgi:hypothetical protein